MSKNKRRLTNKRFANLVAARYGLQVPAVLDAAMRGWINLCKRDHDRLNMKSTSVKRPCGGRTQWQPLTITPPPASARTAAR